MTAYSVYLWDFEDGLAMKQGIDDWMAFYNLDRPHSSLGDRTPDEAYRGLDLKGIAA